ncbi:MAG: phasin family protein [Roseiflexaceae bacterium]
MATRPEVVETVEVTPVEVAEPTERRAQRAVKKVVEQATEVVETVEVKVNEAVSNAQASSTWLIDGFRRIALASIGALAMTIDEAEVLVGKLVERGELAQKDGQKLLGQIRERVVGASPAAAPVEKVGAQLEQGVEEVLTRLNIPTKRDIEELSARIAQLTARIEELKKK